ncbi:MAG: flagellar motor protein MotB [Firmicutes bacterium]|nr:flagellar motor protein MotB [Bacillota bacterium]
MLKKKPEESPPGAPVWMITYGDMVTLVLCFFVALFAFSTIDKQKYVQIAQSLRGALSGGEGVFRGQVSTSDTNFNRYNQMFNQMYQELRRIIDNEELRGKAEITITERGITISFKEKLFFKIGSADILPEAFPILEQVGNVLKERAYPLRIEGHTCDLPINSVQFPSNWELSAIRAVRVSKHLINKVGYRPELISIAGYGEYQPLVPNINEENRAKNRRVDIVIITGRTRSNVIRRINDK